jgi:hypothetical protein
MTCGGTAALLETIRRMSPRLKKEADVNRFRVLTVAVTFAAVILAPTTAHAGGVWDPNEPGHRLDIRWVGVYRQADGLMRVTMTFYDPVRIRWFNPRTHPSRVTVGFTDDPKKASSFWFVNFFRNRANRLSAQLCEGGSGCGNVAGVARPNAFTIRFWTPPFDCCAAGWSFQGITREARAARPGHYPPIIDRTKWGIVS